MATSTSFRISDAARTQLATRAAREGMTATALLDLLIVEGIDQLDYPGIIFRGPAHDRRAALAAGPDVWEVIARLQELDGSEEQRISLLSSESDLHPRLIRIALDYAHIDLNATVPSMASTSAAYLRQDGSALPLDYEGDLPITTTRATTICCQLRN